MNIAFIPIRSGSKGIPGKNMKPLAGKPLAFWTLDTLIAAGGIDEIWLAADCDEYRQQARERYGEKVSIFVRSAESATDGASVMAVVSEFVAFRQPSDDDWICLFQTTSPFTTADEVGALAERIRSGRFDSVVACVRMKKYRWTDDGQPLDYDLRQKPRRQEYDGWLMESGAFYASRAGCLKAAPYILSGRVGIVETGGASCIEIDEPHDWAMAEGYARTIGGKDVE